jgi:hypothetical protein
MMAFDKVKPVNPVWGRKLASHIKQLRILVDEFTCLVYSIRKLFLGAGLIVAIPWVSQVFSSFFV